MSNYVGGSGGLRLPGGIVAEHSVAGPLSLPLSKSYGAKPTRAATWGREDSEQPPANVRGAADGIFLPYAVTSSNLHGSRAMKHVAADLVLIFWGTNQIVGSTPSDQCRCRA